MTDGNEPQQKGKDARWPFVLTYILMWAMLVGSSLNSDPIKFHYTPVTVFGLLAVTLIVVYFAVARWYGYGRNMFEFPHKTVLGNIAWHIFILTGIVFLSSLFFGCLTQIMVLSFDAPIFEPACAVSERDVALFVWDAMAKGAFKFLAKYLHIPTETCLPLMTSWTTTILYQTIRWFTALVVMWYAFSVVKSWYGRWSRASGS